MRPRRLHPRQIPLLAVHVVVVIEVFVVDVVVRGFIVLFTAGHALFLALLARLQGAALAIRLHATGVVVAIGFIVTCQAGLVFHLGLIVVGRGLHRIAAALLLLILGLLAIRHDASPCGP